MVYKESRYKFLGICFISVAIVMGCASDPANTTEEKISSSQSSSDATIADNQVRASEASSSSPASGTEPAGMHSNGQTEGPAPVVAEVEEIDNSDQYVNGKKLSIPKVTGSVPPRDDSYHDTDNNAIVVLQSPTEAMAKFPRDRRKEVDWVKTLDAGYIEPRADLKGKGEMVTMDMDIVMKNTQFMPWVRFPHLQHTKWLACENCHPKIFIPQEHANPISMNKVLRGEFCGVCHDKVSFSLFICERCHSVPHEGSGPAWWKAEK